MEKDIKKDVLFAVPAYSKIMPKYFEKRSAILNRLQQLIKEDTNNKEGTLYRSCEQLHLDDDDDIIWLMQRLANIAAGCIEEHNPSFLINHEVHLLSSWVNALPSGIWSNPQSHSQFDWSGIFYAHVDTPKKGENDLIFINPFPFKQKWAKKSQISFEAKEGMVIIFPSHLTHLLLPHTDKLPRLSISFNLKVLPNSPTPSLIGQTEPS